MIGVFADQHVGQQTRAGHAALDRACRRRRLHDRIAARAGQLRSHVANHFEAHRLQFEHLGDIVAQMLERATAIGAALLAAAQWFAFRAADAQGTRAAAWVGRRSSAESLLFGQKRRRRCASPASSSSTHSSNCSISLLALFAAPPILQAAQLENLQLEALDQQRVGENLRIFGDQLLILGGELRVLLLRVPAASAVPQCSTRRDRGAQRSRNPCTYRTEYRRHVKRFVQHYMQRERSRCAITPRSADRRCAPDAANRFPSSNIDSCAALSDTLPLCACGQMKRPRSKRLAIKHRPVPSHHNSLSRSPRRPRKTKI